MIRLLFDEDVDERIVRGLARWRPIVDGVTARSVGLGGASDPTLLAWAAENGRLVVTADRNTLVGEAWRRVRDGEPMPGVAVVDRRSGLGVLIADLHLLATVAEPEEVAGLVVYLTL